MIIMLIELKVKMKNLPLDIQEEILIKKNILLILMKVAQKKL